MRLAIVAYPVLDEGDRRSIEVFRAKHDPQASRIAMHFTLVFPFEGLPGELASEVGEVARSTQPIPFALRGTKVVRDVFGSGSHIFLVPDEGGLEIATLHDRLYTGILSRHLRADIPFVPHMTVGAHPDPQAAEGLAEGLGMHGRIVRGMLASVELIDVGAPHVVSVTNYALGT